MPRVVHFEIPSKNPAKAAAFYEQVFGWKIQKWDGPQEYWLVQTGEQGTPGIDGAIYQPGEGLSGILNTVDVANLDQAVEKVVQQGGQVQMPKGPVPGIGYLAYCRDPDGNLFGMMQMDPTAGQES
jgi:predicted enzyme related to lactoylglutathione lyase